MDKDIITTPWNRTLEVLQHGHVPVTLNMESQDGMGNLAADLSPENINDLIDQLTRALIEWSKHHGS